MIDIETAVSFAGTTWQAATTFDLLASEGRSAIAVGINHMGKRRVAEYTPFGGEHGGAGTNTWRSWHAR